MIRVEKRQRCQADVKAKSEERDAEREKRKQEASGIRNRLFVLTMADIDPFLAGTEPLLNAEEENVDSDNQEEAEDQANMVESSGPLSLSFWVAVVLAVLNSEYFFRFSV